MKLFKNWHLSRALPWILIVFGSIGLFASAMTMIDKVKLLENPSFSAICDVNPVISCGSVTQSEQGSVFGFPNPIIGLVTFPVMITTGMAVLAGAKLKRWYWIGLQIGTLFGVGFVHWLFYQSVYSIGSLCLFCMTAWIATITTFWYVTIFNIDTGNIKLPNNLASIGKFARDHHLDILILWFLIIAALMLKHFWYYYGPKLGL